MQNSSQITSTTYSQIPFDSSIQQEVPIIHLIRGAQSSGGQQILEKMEIRTQQEIQKFIDDGYATPNLAVLTIAIIGIQSSGKSTLLNTAFNTNFMMMKSEVGSQQTTVGIWMANMEQQRIILLDIEGSDSSERGKNGCVIERQQGLFGLLMSDVLIVNIECKSVSRSQSGQFELLKDIFSMTLSSEQLLAKKKIIYSIRDFPKDSNSKLKLEQSIEMIKKNLRHHFNQIENSVRGSPYKNKCLEDCFDLDFVPFRNYEYDLQGFTEDAIQFRHKLEAISVSMLSNPGSGTKTNQIAQKMVSVWQTIKESKNFDSFDLIKIRDQVYCSDTVAEAKDRADAYFQNLSQEIQKNPIIGNKMVDSRSQDCFQFYKEKTKNCNAEIRDLKIAELDDHLSRLKQNLMHEARKLQNQMCKKIKDIVQNSSDQQLFLISDSIKNSSLKDEDLNYRLSRIIELGIEQYRRDTNMYYSEISNSFQTDLEQYIQNGAQHLRNQNSQKKQEEKKILDSKKENEQKLINQVHKLHLESQEKYKRLAEDSEKKIQSMRDNLEGEFSQKMHEASKLQAEEFEKLRTQTKIEFDKKIESERETILLDRDQKIAELQKENEARLESIQLQNKNSQEESEKKNDQLWRAVWKTEEKNRQRDLGLGGLLEILLGGMFEESRYQEWKHEKMKATNISGPILFNKR